MSASEIPGSTCASELASLLTRAGRLIASATATFDDVDARSPYAQSTMSAYFAELDERFPGGFDPGDALATDAAQFDAPDGRFVVVHDRDDPIGCGGLRSLDPETGEIKRMWISASWRRCGLAVRLLGELEQRSRSIGHSAIRLDTNSALATAISMYEQAGYRPIERYNDNPYVADHAERLRTGSADSRFSRSETGNESMREPGTCTHSRWPNRSQSPR